MSGVRTKAKPREESTYRSGHCNLYLKAVDQHHEICAIEQCTCECHERYAIFWTNWDETAGMQVGFLELVDARLALDMMKTAGLIPPDSASEVDGYRDGRCPW